MNMYRNICCFGLALACVPLLGNPAWAVPIISFQTTNGNTAPTTPSVSTDLLQTSLLSVSPVPGGTNLLTHPHNRNGSTGTAHENSGTNPATIHTANTYDFNFDLTTNTLGYDITGVNLYTGWTDFRAGQDEELFYSLVGDPNFISFADINQTHSNGTLLSMITDTTGLIASGVDAIRVRIDQSQFVYRELDVFGTATAPPPPPQVPEPASVAIWSILGLGLAGYIRHRRKRARK